MQIKRSVINCLYFPGLISLICIPLLTFGYLLHRNTFRELYQMNVAWMSTEELVNPNSHLADGVNQLKSRHYFDINLTGYSREDSLKLVALKPQLKHLGVSKDYKNGCRINFSRHVSYQTVITTFDIGRCYADTFKLTAVNFGDSFYLFRLKPSGKPVESRSPPDGLMFICGTGLHRKTIMTPFITFWNDTKAILPPCILLILMLPMFTRHFKSCIPRYKIK